MGIRNTKLLGTDWGDEALKPITDLNPTFDAVAYRQIDSDAVGGTENTGVDTTIKTYSIVADAITRFIEVSVDTNHNLRYDNSGGTETGVRKGKVSVYAGPAGSEVLIKSWTSGFNAAQDIVSANLQNTLSVYYAPSSGEKTAGFNVLIKVQAINVETGGASSYYAGVSTSRIMGA